MWLNVALVGMVAPFIFVAYRQDSDPQPLTALLATVTTAPVWGSLSLLAGAIAGLGATLATKLGQRWRGMPWVLICVGAVGSAVAMVAVARVMLGPSNLITTSLATAPGGALVGGLAVAFTHRRAAKSTSSRWLLWGIATGLWAAVTILGFVKSVAIMPFIAREECAARLHAPLEEVVFAESGFPPQLWCLAGESAELWGPIWVAPALVAGVTATAILGLVAIWHLANPPVPDRVLPGRGWLISSICVITALGILAAIAAANPTPSAEVLADAKKAQKEAQEAARNPPPSPSLVPTRPPSPTPSTRPSLRAATAKSALTDLAKTARDAGGTTLLWPEKATVSASECRMPTGRSGKQFLLRAKFTTRDPAEVHGPQEVLELSRANEAIAEKIAQAWLASRHLSGSERIHSEWYLGGPPDGAVETAHLGFADTLGEIRISTRCTISS